MRYLTIIACFVCFFTSTQTKAQPDNFFQKADQFFSKYVENGLVNYRAINENPRYLNKLVKSIAHADLPEANNATKKAFYLNAYNLLAIKNVINHYPIKSPMDVEGFFDEIEHTIAGKSMTLDELEKQTLLELYPDARLHFALICAAMGCPPIKDGAYFPEKLDEQLDKQTRKALSDEDFIKVNEKGRTAKVSQIFKWYRKDFLNEANSILGYINKYREYQLASDTRLSYYEYDWSLNALKKN